MNISNLKKSKILIVDDDDLSQHFLQDTMQKIGCKDIFMADNFKDAMHLTQLHQPDFITLDIYMPEVDGWSLLHQLRELAPRSRIIMVTGSSLTEDFLTSIKKNADGYCVKPVLPDLMIKAMLQAKNKH